jgi:hypothetical protein
MKLNELKSETERLEKGCGKEISRSVNNIVTLCGIGNNFIRLTKDKVKLAYRFDLCPTCKIKLSTLMKTSWIFARKELKDIILLNKKISRRFKDKWTVDIITNPFSKELQEIISYCEAKAKEHKIELEEKC